MPPTITKTQRWLDLTSYLVGRRYPVQVGELMERLPVYAAMREERARRTFERDKDELQTIEIPLVCQRSTVDGLEERFGYLLSTYDFFLPYLRIVEGTEMPKEQRAIMRAGLVELTPEHLADSPESPFAAEARSAFAKLALDLNATALSEVPGRGREGTGGGGVGSGDRRAGGGAVQGGAAK